MAKQMLNDNETILGKEIADSAIDKINKTKEEGGNDNEEKEKTTKKPRNNTK